MSSSQKTVARLIPEELHTTPASDLWERRQQRFSPSAIITASTASVRGASCPPGPPHSLWKEEKQGSLAGHVLSAFITLSTSFCLKDRCILKAQVSFIFLIKDVQHRF